MPLRDPFLFANGCCISEVVLVNGFALCLRGLLLFWRLDIGEVSFASIMMFLVFKSVLACRILMFFQQLLFMLLPEDLARSLVHGVGLVNYWSLSKLFLLRYAFA